MLRRAQKRKTLKNVFLEKGREERDSKVVPKEKKKEKIIKKINLFFVCVFLLIV